MPRLSCWFIRSALIYLATGFTLGALLLSNKGIPYAPAIWNLLPLHIEFLLHGWLIQLAMGVAFWILPRLGQGPNNRGDERLVWAAWLLVNLGIILALFEALLVWPGLAIGARLVELAGVLLFVLGSWKRVKPFPA